MENTEIMNEVMDTVVNDVVVDDVITKGNGMNLVVKGSLVVAGLAAGAVLAKKIYDVCKARQANKEPRQPDKEIIVEEEDLAKVTE